MMKGCFVLIGGLLSLLFVTSNAIGEEVWTDPGANIEFVRVEGGCFQMGQQETNRDELERVRGSEFFVTNFADELPRHEVCVEPFYISRNEVSVEQFRTFVEQQSYQTESERTGGCYLYQDYSYKWLKDQEVSWFHPGFKQSERDPVVCVSWNDASALAAWLNTKQSGMKISLPSEAQWEFAARGGGDQKYAGNDTLEAVAWQVKNSDRHTHPGGTKDANGLGLADMSGNVWEWVSDWYGPKYYEASPRENPAGPETGSLHALRGGGWNSFAWNCRPAKRDHAGPTHADTNLGVRLVARPGK